MAQTIRFYQGNLPHWLVADCPYFVTICLWGVLPAHKICELKQEQLELTGEIILNKPKQDPAWKRF
jgi:hypothetical protein